MTQGQEQEENQGEDVEVDTVLNPAELSASPSPPVPGPQHKKCCHLFSISPALHRTPKLQPNLPMNSFNMIPVSAMQDWESWITIPQSWGFWVTHSRIRSPGYLHPRVRDSRYLHPMVGSPRYLHPTIEDAGYLHPMAGVPDYLNPRALAYTWFSQA